MTFSRLATFDKELDARLRAATPEVRALVARTAAHAAVAANRVAAPLVSSALLSGEDSGLIAYVEALDAEYFRLSELEKLGQAAEAQVLSAFRKARSVSSVALALSGEPAEALYEALHSVPDPAPIRAAVARVMVGGA